MEWRARALSLLHVARETGGVLIGRLQTRRGCLGCVIQVYVTRTFGKMIIFLPKPGRNISSCRPRYDFFLVLLHACEARSGARFPWQQTTTALILPRTCCVCVFFSAVFWDISVVDRFGSDRFFFRFLSWDSDDAILKDLAWILQLSHFGS